MILMGMESSTASTGLVVVPAIMDGTAPTGSGDREFLGFLLCRALVEASSFGLDSAREDGCDDDHPMQIA